MGSVPPGARRLRVATRLEGKSAVVLSVQDTGGGIALKDRERIFDPFFTTKASGMGLGLAISRTIAQEQGGDLRIAKTDNQGSVFEMALPTASEGESRRLVPVD